MTVGFVAFHYPRPEDFDDFVARVHQVGAVLRSVPGCLSVDCWVTTDGDDAAVVSTGQWESDEAFAASFAAVAAADVDVAFDAREHRPRQIFELASR